MTVALVDEFMSLWEVMVICKRHGAIYAESDTDKCATML